MSWINDPVNSPKHYTDSHPGMECIDLALVLIDELIKRERDKQ